MDKKTRQMRKDLGYEIDVEDTFSDEHSVATNIPSWVFGYSALLLFVIGVIGMWVELSSKDSEYLTLYFSFSFFLAPAILIYPVFRFVLGEGKAGLSAILSAVFGYYIQSKVKKKMDDWS